MICSFLPDLSAALAALPAEHPRRRILQLLDEALRRDIHFVDRHPTTLFLCFWNTCWWYDTPEAAKRKRPDTPWWRRLETRVENSETHTPVAWFPAGFEHLAAHPDGRVWAGASGKHLYLFTLTGDLGGREECSKSNTSPLAPPPMS